METNQNYLKLDQSASALGAAILGFGLGAKWGNVASGFALIIILIGAVFHVWGMYIMQMKSAYRKNNMVARALWISAWICLIALIVIIIYLLLIKP